MAQDKEQNPLADIVEKLSQVAIDEAAKVLPLEDALSAPLAAYLIAAKRWELGVKLMEPKQIMVLVYAFQKLKNEVAKLQAENAVLKAQKTPVAPSN